MTDTLYALTDHLVAVHAWIEDHGPEIVANGGELPPEIQAELDAIEGSFTEKAERVELYARSLLLHAVACKAEAARLTQRAAVRTKAADGLREYLKVQMMRAGKTRVEAPLVDLTVCANPQPRVSYRDGVDLEHIYAATEIGCTEYVVRIEHEHEYSLDRTRILATWKEARAEALFDVNTQQAQLPVEARMTTYEIQAEANARAAMCLPDWLVVEAGYHVRSK